jgi:hypothetical protein
VFREHGAFGRLGQGVPAQATRGGGGGGKIGFEARVTP